MPHLAVVDKGPEKQGMLPSPWEDRSAKEGARLDDLWFPQSPAAPKPSLLPHVALRFQQRHSCLGILSSQSWAAPAIDAVAALPKGGN